MIIWPDHDLVREARTRENKQIIKTIEDLYGIDKKKKLCIILVIGYGSGRDKFRKFIPIDEPDSRIKHDFGIVEDPELPKKLTFAVPMKVIKQGTWSELRIDFF